MKILNLYAGIGGNRKLWPEGHEITAVELNPKIAAIYQKNFPNDQVIIADAHQFLLEHFKEYDFIWSSPPCPTHSICNMFLHAQGTIRYPDMALYQEVILLQTWAKCKWVIENVKPYYETLIKPQYSGRHCFWANFTITDIPLPPDFTRFAGKKNTVQGSRRAMGDNKLEERNMVNPKLGLHVFNCAFKIKQRNLLT